MLTGEAAVTLGADGQGMVAGDLVNTASRIQSAAEPGHGARRRGDAARDRGGDRVRGRRRARAEGQGRADAALARAARRRRPRRRRPLGRARGAVRRPRPRAAPRQGALPRERRGAQGAPRLGDRDRAGSASRGSSWEFEKYIDGLARDVLWHRGRCLVLRRGRRVLGARRDGARCAPGSSRTRTRRSALREARAASRSTSPTRRSATGSSRGSRICSGSTTRRRDREDLFAAWRLFFERLADRSPSVLVFEDLQWADAGLLDFIEYLLEWSRDQPIFVARPRATRARRAATHLGAPTRGSFTRSPLEPLSDRRDGRAARRPRPRPAGRAASGRSSTAPKASRSTPSRPCGCCSTAACSSGERTRTELVGDDRVTRGARDAARARRRPARRRSQPDGARVVQDASVLGKTFLLEASRRCRAARRTSSSRCSRRSCARRFSSSRPIRAPPERGQYGFLQDLVRRVAYETLAQAATARRATSPQRSSSRHSWGGREQEIVEVVASHYLTALDLEPDAGRRRGAAHEECARRSRARASGRRPSARTAKRRRRSQRSELTDDPLEKARLLANAGCGARAHR